MLSGRTEADKQVTLTARTGGVLTELKVQARHAVKKGDVIAVLSDEAREAQVAQARSLVTQRKTELEAKRKLIETGAMPKLDLVNLEAQLKAAEGGARRGRGRARPRRHPRAVGRRRQRRAGRGRPGRVLVRRAPIC